MAARVEEQERKVPGLYSKFSVTTRDSDCLEAGCFVLVPFNKDGTVRDQNAIDALLAYARATGSIHLVSDIQDWIANPTKYNWVNEPRP